MGWPKGKSRGKQTSEHLVKRVTSRNKHYEEHPGKLKKEHSTPVAKANHSAAQKKFHKEHPEHLANQSAAGRESRNTPETYALIQQYGYPLINLLRGKYWNINYRCNNPNCSIYGNYGGRGIQNLFISQLHFLNYVIFELGITTFEQIEDLQIDRIDNDSHYMPGNIRFVTPKVNNNNRRKVY